MLLIALTFAVGVGAASAADKPNFTGEWISGKSNNTYAAIPYLDQLVHKVTHVGTSHLPADTLYCARSAL